MYSTGPTIPATKSRSGAAQAKKPAATRRGIARGASAGAITRPSSAPESACVKVSNYEIGVRALFPGVEHGAGDGFFTAFTQLLRRVDAIACFLVLAQLPLADEAHDLD